MKIAIQNVYIVTMKNEEVLFDYNVVIKNDIITYIGKEFINEKYDRIIDGKNMVLMPGLINMHSHIAMTLFRGIGVGLSLQEWLEKKIWPIEQKLTGEDIYYGSLLACMEMLSSGTTCCNDMYLQADKVVEAIKSSQMRGCIAYNYVSDMKDGFDTLDISFKTNQLLENSHHYNKDQIYIFLGPHSIYTCSLEYLKYLKEVANKNHTCIQIHVSETEKEVKDCIQKYGKTPIGLLDSIGFLDDSIILAHCVHITKQDAEILAKHRVTVVTNTSSNLILGSGICPIDKLLDENINVTIGTDGAASNNNLNMFEEMHLTALVRKGIEQNSKVLPAYKILKMATISAAQALKLEDRIGTVEVGKEADLILIDMNKPHLLPNHDIINNLVYSVQGSDVYLTMVKGNILYENGVFNTLHKEEIYQKIDTIRKRLFKNNEE